jgi:DNA invertase Pin-like site-specific DNA recombinase
MKKAISYARISGAHTQTELSIKEQIIQIRKYAQEKGITIEKEFQEKHSAFKREKNNLTKRVIFTELLEYLSKNKINYLLIFKWDRISRIDKEFILLEETCEKF